MHITDLSTRKLAEFGYTHLHRLYVNDLSERPAESVSTEVKSHVELMQKTSQMKSEEKEIETSGIWSQCISAFNICADGRKNVNPLGCFL